MRVGEGSSINPKTIAIDVNPTDAKLELPGLPRAFFQRDPRQVAPELLNKILARDDGRAGRIIEVEAYCGAEDPAAHTFRGPTKRNRTMFGPAGHLYVHFTYGMHWCCNTVCGAEGQGWGVLVRAVAPIAGIEQMRLARPRAHTDCDLANGPAKLTQAFGIDGSFDGADIIVGNRGVTVLDDATPPPSHPRVGPRIGVSQGKDLPWRWRIP